jgi:hypothetical protein
VRKANVVGNSARSPWPIRGEARRRTQEASGQVTIFHDDEEGRVGIIASRRSKVSVIQNGRCIPPVIQLSDAVKVAGGNLTRMRDRLSVT